MSEPANSMWMHRITYDGGDPTEWRIGKAPAYIKDGNNRVEECLFAPASPSPTSADAVVEACAVIVADYAGKQSQIAAAIRALKGTFPDAPEAKSEVAGLIKPLKWEDGPPGTYTEIAGSPFGQYSVWEINGTGCWSPWKAESGSIVEGGIKAAKAAAQSDYEARVRSALVDPEGGV